jgi:FAD/FMN-containing dehydrogenase
MNPGTDKRPALVAQCKHEEDILRCIDFAHRRQMEVAVRSGNHSPLGWGSCERGIVIDLSQMKGVAVDPVKRIARASTGNSAEEILAATAPYGLAPVLGECGSVGSGLALGGGLGWLAGKYGTTSDNLLSARLITADGRTLKTDTGANEDLFWAIRGGGGNFGVATLLEYQLHPVSEVLTESFGYPASKAKSMLRFFREFMATAPDELQAECYVATHNGGGVAVEFVYAGNLDEGERLLETFRKSQTPAEDSVKRRSFADIYKMDVEDGMPCPFESEKRSYIEALSDEVIDLILDCFAQSPPSCDTVFNFAHYMHGQVCRVAPDATAFELRRAAAVHLGFWVQWKDQAKTSACMAWSDKTFDRLQPYSGGRVASNFVSTKGELTAKSIYGSNYARLKQLKTKYDPENFFHLNQNIQPN